MPSPMLNYPATFEERVQYTKAAIDAMATDVTAADYFYNVKDACELVAVAYIPATAAALNASNFATIIVNKHDGAGGAGTVAAQGDSSATAFAVGVPFKLNPSATVANRQFAAGTVASFQITKTGTGVATPRGTLIATFRLLNP